jgi:hypothetical protein
MISEIAFSKLEPVVKFHNEFLTLGPLQKQDNYLRTMSDYTHVNLLWKAQPVKKKKKE